MFRKILILFVVLTINSALSRNVPRFSDLDEEDQHLFRAAYENSYDNDLYEEDDGKMDLVKDGLWAIKAKIKELKAFDKALAASMLSTKLKVKDLLENHLGEVLNHHHKKKPSYDYQQPSYQPQYGAPQYSAGAAHPGAGSPHYSAGAPHYSAGAPHYGGGSQAQYGVGAGAAVGVPQYGHDPYYGH